MFIPGTFKLTWLAFAAFVIGIMTAEVMDALLRGQIPTFITKHPVHAALTVPLNLLIFLLVRRQLHIVRADRQRAPSERERVRVKTSIFDFGVSSTPFIHLGVSTGAYAVGFVTFFFI